jgi:hypothetical protein
VKFEPKCPSICLPARGEWEKQLADKPFEINILIELRGSCKPTLTVSDRKFQII